MVFFFTSVTDAGRFELYMGRDKMENEDLIKFGWPEDVWFHVDDMSSAHVYLRLPAGLSIKDIPAVTLADCAQLVKANSILGNKKTTGKVRIVYTAWSNLHKTNGMEAGQVSFHDTRKLMYTDVEKRENAIVNRLEKTRVEKPTSSIKESKEKRDADERRQEKLAKQKKAEEDAKNKVEHKKFVEERSYDRVFANKAEMTSNAEITQNADSFEDDFM